MTQQTRDDQWEIDDLVARYTAEPDLADIFVEGEWDATVIKRVLKENHCREAAVYEINSVRIGAETVASYCNKVDNRSRVVTLAHEIVKHVGTTNGLTCLIDADYDHVVKANWAAKPLLSTDYSCLESYFITESVLDKFLDMVVRNCPLGAAQFIPMLKDSLRFLYITRATKEQMGLNIPMVRIKKYHESRRDAIVLKKDEYIQSLLMSGKQFAPENRKAFQEKWVELEALTSHDIRHCVHKEDVFELMAHYLSQFDKNGGLSNPNYVARSVAGCINFSTLSKEPMFAALIKRVGG